MISELKNIWAIFIPPERRESLWTLALVVLMAMAETASVFPIMPFVPTVGRPDVIHRNNWLQATYNYLNFRAPHDFIVALGMPPIAPVIASSAFKTAVARLTSNEASGADQRAHEVARKDLSRARYRDYAA